MREAEREGKEGGMGRGKEGNLSQTCTCREWHRGRGEEEGIGKVGNYFACSQCNPPPHAYSHAQHLPARPIPPAAGGCPVLCEGCHCQPHSHHLITGQLPQDLGTGVCVG